MNRSKNTKRTRIRRWFARARAFAIAGLMLCSLAQLDATTEAGLPKDQLKAAGSIVHHTLLDAVECDPVVDSDSETPLATSFWRIFTPNAWLALAHADIGHDARVLLPGHSWRADAARPPPQNTPRA